MTAGVPSGDQDSKPMQETEQDLETPEKLTKLPSAQGDGQGLVISWNAAGFARSYDLIKVHYGSMASYLSRHQAAILCVQETKCRSGALRTVAESKNLGAVLDGFQSFWAFNEQKGAACAFNGVATWVSDDLVKVNGARATQEVLGDAALDQEGRCLLVDLGTLAVFNVYAPSVPLGDSVSASKTAQLAAKKFRFLGLLEKRVQEMKQLGKKVIVCGDMNLTWRAADTRALRVCVRVEDGIAGGRKDWQIPPQKKEQVFLRAGEVAKLLRQELEVSVEEAKSLIATLVTCDDGLQVSVDRLRSSEIQKGRVLLEAQLMSTETVTDEDGSTCPSLQEVLAILDKADAAATVRLAFGIPLAKIASAGLPPHVANEEASVELFSKWVRPGGFLVDTFAECHGNAVDRFTFWSGQANNRFANRGTRIDYILCDRDLCENLIASPASELRGSSKLHAATSAEAAMNAATNFGNWHGAHQIQKGMTKKHTREDGGGLSLQQDDMRLNDSQFRPPHTGILYTPPRYSDHVPVCALFRDLVPGNGKLIVSEDKSKHSTPWVAQASISSFFGRPVKAEAKLNHKKQRTS
mmetsp:Transcript_101101/g.179443  ORF Transcript_101101/g.179443 Transcript_101101/m.179443 type:complete len:580 (+) Transcript_101101:32-1771(+)|eukprot:CAMPEP_0197651046 /NCGR_PEP_ID=MMETSP1338-20131121/31318_1 /TAXON_ID=43686 ORGANISM="Pelagodinium beii, Strain RCC1491" /NCGR_SAMPLE_ID=MMETSP1338 /ASSEMBLY_ACC=CAM_ASM_000754 /LENGTH=579 /DNA_ID=CAMNT_0043225591 /DNA_START=31 /DNA_END=1770 /DNA_ORIENTATION=-